MLNFRQKIFISYVLIFLVFIALMSPVASLIVHRIVERAMENRAVEIIAKIQPSSSNKEMILKLKEIKPFVFFRITLIGEDRKVIYDSHTKQVLGPKYNQDHLVNDTSVGEAFSRGTGYAEGFSESLLQKFAYTAALFESHGEKFVIRTAFPYRYVKELINDFEIGFLLLASLVLILFSFMTWFIINRATRPIQEIITIAANYKENERNPLPELREFSARVGKEDFGKLANTLVSLSERLQNQIAKLREERNEKEVLLDSLVEGVIAVDPHMVMTYVNTAAVKFLSLEKGSLIGRSFQTLGQERAFELLLSCQKEDKPIIDTLRIDAAGKTFFLDVIAVPKRDNTGAILVMLDKSDHYKILEMRKDFIANASHELKTPITIIRGFAETLFDHPDLAKEITQDITAKIVRNCERMATLVRDLLALADIENIPSSRIQRFNLKELIEKVKLDVLEVFHDAHIKTNGENIMIEGDLDLIEMALLNLMTNAVKYSNHPAEVSVDIAEAADIVTLIIADCGIGISDMDISRIFERFYRVDKARSRKVGGSGLGLSIVETVIKKHFGSIDVKSEVGVGTTFTIKLPLHHFHFEG
jgi:two-component system, OmpR family, phosphate regulon sensor histidine kinase PhoR